MRALALLTLTVLISCAELGPWDAVPPQGGGSCADACHNLVKLGCYEDDPGCTQSCEAARRALSETGSSLDVSCLATVESCEAADDCGS